LQIEKASGTSGAGAGTLGAASGTSGAGAEPSLPRRKFWRRGATFAYKRKISTPEEPPKPGRAPASGKHPASGISLRRRGRHATHACKTTMTAAATRFVAGRYQLLAPLGAGGMGKVLRGWDTALGRAVAVKVLHAERLADADRARASERLRREAQSI